MVIFFDVESVENEAAAELARLDRVERHLRRLDAFSETARIDVALARELAWKLAASLTRPERDPESRRC